MNREIVVLAAVLAPIITALAFLWDSVQRDKRRIDFLIADWERRDAKFTADAVARLTSPPLRFSTAEESERLVVQNTGTITIATSSDWLYRPSEATLE